MKWLNALLATICTVPIAASGQSSADAQVCREIARGAVDAARLRDQGVSKSGAVEQLTSRLGSNASPAVNAAYFFTDLKEFPLEDFASAYCVMSMAKPELSEFDRLMLKTRLDISARCTREGHIERKPFFECWNRQVAGAKKAPQ